MSVFCTNCGAGIPEGKKFCTGCGAKIEDMAMAPQPAMVGAGSQPAPMAQQAYAPGPPPPFPAEPPPPKGSPYALISAWGYIGYFLLMGLPIVGLILTIVWACAKSGSLSRRNLARAMLLFMGLVFVCTIVSTVLVWPVITQAFDISFN